MVTTNPIILSNLIVCYLYNLLFKKFGLQVQDLKNNVHAQVLITL